MALDDNGDQKMYRLMLMLLEMGTHVLTYQKVDLYIEHWPGQYECHSAKCRVIGMPEWLSIANVGSRHHPTVKVAWVHHCVALQRQSTHEELCRKSTTTMHSMHRVHEDSHAKHCSNSPMGSIPDNTHTHTHGYGHTDGDGDGGDGEKLWWVCGDGDGAS